MYAVIRIRGKVNVNQRIARALEILRLKKVNHCVLLPENPTSKGMLAKVRNWVTWGEISPEVEKLLKEKREATQPEPRKKAGHPVFRLSPPSKGYKSIKIHYPRGDLGYRGEKINELLRRMV